MWRVHRLDQICGEKPANPLTYKSVRLWISGFTDWPVFLYLTGQNVAACIYRRIRPVVLHTIPSPLLRVNVLPWTKNEATPGNSGSVTVRVRPSTPATDFTKTCSSRLGRISRRLSIFKR